jgi:hypothetical protein
VNAKDPLGLVSICGTHPGSSACKAATKQDQKRAAERCNEDGAEYCPRGKPNPFVDAVKDAAGAIKKHWRGELQVVGTVAAVASAATGVGALADVGVLGLDATTSATVSTVTGLTSSAADLPSCVAGDETSCVGAALGGVAGIGSGASSLLSASNAAIEASGGSLSFAQGVLPGIIGSHAFGLGLGGLAWDASNDAGNNG